ncbi:hypothetical protein PJP07_30780, partial [Mycobacterium kansasii]
RLGSSSKKKREKHKKNPCTNKNGALFLSQPTSLKNKNTSFLAKKKIFQQGQGARIHPKNPHFLYFL